MKGQESEDPEQPGVKSGSFAGSSLILKGYELNLPALSEPNCLRKWNIINVRSSLCWLRFNCSIRKLSFEALQMVVASQLRIY